MAKTLAVVVARAAVLRNILGSAKVPEILVF
jgi:hypothetical protein